MKTLARATDTAHGDSVAQELDRLSHLQLPRLRAEWLERWGEEVAYRSRDQLFRAMAYRIQADAYGGLSGRLRRELSDLGARFAEDRARRAALGGQAWQMDEDLLAALATMPPCAGIAVGFDRLAMLATGAARIGDVLWLPDRES